MPKGQQAHTCVYGIIINNDNKVLLMKRANTGFSDGMYTIPGGKIDDLELPSTAFIREMQEEVNLNINKSQLNCVMTQHRISYGYACVDFYYLVKEENADLTNIKINEPHKCDELKWVDVNNLPNELLEYVRNAITLHNKVKFIEDDSSYLVDKNKAV
jgi:mutator protein MutT